MPPHLVDTHVGNKIRHKRKALGISQQDLGDMVGVTFQQIQKYEKGTNRIGSSRLYEISRSLNTPVVYFFEGLEVSPAYGQTQHLGFAEPQNTFTHMTTDAEQNTLLTTYFSQIKSKPLRNELIRLIKLLNSDEQAHHTENSF